MLLSKAQTYSHIWEMMYVQSYSLHNAFKKDQVKKKTLNVQKERTDEMIHYPMEYYTVIKNEETLHMIQNNF